MSRKGRDGQKQLVAFYRAAATTADQLVQLSYEELRAHVVTTLPDYMVPAAFVSLAAIPLTPNGKVDRRALARLDVSMTSGRAYAAPRSDTERLLVAIWAHALKLAPETIGVHDSFFELGGHSLLATQVIAKMRGQLDVDVPLKTLFERTSVAQLAEYIATSQKSGIPPIQPIDRAQFERLPLSFAQERLWFINQLEPESAGYNVPGAVIVNGELDVDRLEEAFNLIIARHENLRTVFPSQDGRAHQRILDRVDFTLERIDLRACTKDARDAKARELCQTDATTPFDVANGPLLRGKVITLAEHEHILMLNMHHIISDGWSVGVMLKELGRFWMPSVTAGARRWRRCRFSTSTTACGSASGWTRAGSSSSNSPTGNRSSPAFPRVWIWRRITRGRACEASPGRPMRSRWMRRWPRQLKRLADQHGGTLYMVLLAAFKALLIATAANAISVSAARSRTGSTGETEDLIGMFVNTLALRSQVDGDDTFAALLSKVKTTCLEAYEHQDAPFEKVVDTVRPQRNLAVSPLFQVMLVLQNLERGAFDPSMQAYPLETGLSKFDLSVAFLETPEGLTGSIEYSTALFTPQTIARLVEHLTAICRAITLAPTGHIDDLDYLGEREKRQLLIANNATEAEYPRDKCLHELFAEQVAAHPDQTAVVFGEHALSYRELAEKSGDLARYLQAQGVTPDTSGGSLPRPLARHAGRTPRHLAGRRRLCAARSRLSGGATAVHAGRCRRRPSCSRTSG